MRIGHPHSIRCKPINFLDMHNLIKNIAPLPKRLTNWKIAIAFSALLPAFNIINNSQFRIHTDLDRIILSWVVTFTFLLSSWYINALLTTWFANYSASYPFWKKVLMLFLINTLLLVVFILIGVFVIEDIGGFLVRRDSAYLLVFLKGLTSIGLIYIMQYALDSDARAQEATLQNQKLKTENIRAQYELLRQQVNPHFLFNSLSTLHSMVRTDQENAGLFILKLSEIYRQILLKREKEVVSLREEMQFVEDYLFMIRARFEAGIHISTEIPDAMKPMLLPTFSVQLMIENCVKHNVISREKPLYIKIFAAGEQHLIIENNFQPKVSQDEPSGYGLQSLMERYDLLGQSDGISVFTDEQVFRVKLKLMQR